MYPKISVVVPVYNVENYLEECLNSIINQIYKNLEIILVNDGSTDNSYNICNEYAKKDTRIVVINKKNGGLSSARNAGIKKATGDYVVFIDSDDFWCDDKVAQKIVERIVTSNCEVVLFGFKYYYESRKQLKSYFNYDNLTEEFNCNDLKSIVKNNLYISSACVKVIKRDILIKYNMFFKEGVTSEDIEWSAKLLLNVSNISIILEDLYIYRQRENSISRGIKEKNIIDLINNIESCIEEINKIKDLTQKEIYCNYVSYQYITLLNLLNYVKFKTTSYKKQSKNYCYLLNYHWNVKVKLIYKVNKFFGFNIMMLLLKYYIKLKGARV